MKPPGRGISLSIFVLVTMIIAPPVSALDDSNTSLGNDTSVLLLPMTITGPESSPKISESDERSGGTLLMKSASLEARTTSSTGNISGIEWQKVMGGSWGESFFDINQTDDGGYIAVGATGSKDGDVASGWLGWAEAWVVKMSANGTIQWQKLYGGYGYDQGMSIEPTADGGYIFAGFSNSTDGDFAGYNYGGQDAWVVKLYANGTKSWQVLLGGNGDDAATSITPTSEGGCIVTGYTDSPVFNDTRSTLARNGGTDVFIVELGTNGKPKWKCIMGGSGYDKGSTVTRTSDSGSVVAGFTNSTNSGDIGSNHGDYDIWVAKMNSDGGINWKKLLGGSKAEVTAYDNVIQQTSDGGYVLVGQTASKDGDVGTNHGSSDVWVVRLDEDGDIKWNRSFGGTGYDRGNAIRQTPDGDFILIGDTTSSSSGDVADTNHGNWDAWVVKLDPDGNLLWQSTLGGTSYEQGNSILPTADGGFITAGQTWSDNTGTVAGTYHRYEDAWVMKLKPRLVVDVFDSDSPSLRVSNANVFVHDVSHNEDQNVTAANGRAIFSDFGGANQYGFVAGNMYAVNASAAGYRTSDLKNVKFIHDGQKVTLKIISTTRPTIGQTYSITNAWVEYDSSNSPPFKSRFDSVNYISNITRELNADAGWTQAFPEINGTNIQKAQFGVNPTSTDKTLNNATLHWHIGHGGWDLNDDHTAILLPARYNPTTGDFDYYWLKASDVTTKWGGNNKWVVLQDCYILNDTDWGKDLGTTHGIFGFTTPTDTKSALPSTFLKYAKSGKTLYDSWLDATHDVYYNDVVATEWITGPDGKPKPDNYNHTVFVHAGTIFQTSTQRDQDHLPGTGLYVAPDVDPNVQEEAVPNQWNCSESRDGMTS